MAGDVRFSPLASTFRRGVPAGERSSPPGRSSPHGRSSSTGDAPPLSTIGLIRPGGLLCLLVASEIEQRHEGPVSEAAVQASVRKRFRSTRSTRGAGSTATISIGGVRSARPSVTFQGGRAVSERSRPNGRSSPTCVACAISDDAKVSAERSSPAASESGPSGRGVRKRFRSFSSTLAGQGQPRHFGWRHSVRRALLASNFSGDGQRAQHPNGRISPTGGASSRVPNWMVLCREGPASAAVLRQAKAALQGRVGGRETLWINLDRAVLLGRQRHFARRFPPHTPTLGSVYSGRGQRAKQPYGRRAVMSAKSDGATPRVSVNKAAPRAAVCRNTLCRFRAANVKGPGRRVRVRWRKRRR